MRLLTISGAFSVALVSLVVLAASLVTPSVGRSQSLAAPASAPTVRLAAPAVHPPRAHVAGAYVHAANCEQALIGANGDNDIANWINTHTPYGIDSWSFSGPIEHTSNTDVSIPINTYRAGHFIGGLLGECWGDDSAITDKVWGF